MPANTDFIPVSQVVRQILVDWLADIEPNEYDKDLLWQLWRHLCEVDRRGR